MAKSTKSVVESNGKAKKSTKAVKAAAPVAEKSVERDAFGNRAGTFAYTVNALLSSTPVMPAALRKLLEGEAKNLTNHLRWLASKGLVVHSKEGWALPAPQNNGRAKKGSRKAKKGAE